ncbi:MAG TPA: type II toxin-antitoxin system RelE/ParE family toxin [Stellaceae bacterium]|nr:type II toxin-antitoxin system RelE/ParE family toxin [Stellaceae bacterium]
MAQVTFADAALAGVEDIRSFIAAENPDAAERIALLLIDAAASLSNPPLRGTPVEGGGRKLITSHYVIFYRVTADGEQVTITAIIDGRRLR